MRPTFGDAGVKRLSDPRLPTPIPLVLLGLQLMLAMVALALLGPSPVSAGTAGDVDRPGLAFPAVTAPASEPVGQHPAPRFQPVGQGDAITSPAQPNNPENTDSGLRWRIAFGAAVVVVVLVALVQRRQVPERGRGVGQSRNDRPNNRNVLGH